MSRSKKKTPIHGHACCRSEKRDKQHWHRSWRSKARMHLLKSIRVDGGACHIDIVRNEVSSPWTMGKDGKAYWSNKERMDYFERNYPDLKQQLIRNILFFRK